MRPIFPRSIPPAQSIVVHEADPAQHALIIDTRSAMAPWGKMAPDAPSARPLVNAGRSSSVSVQRLDQIYPPGSMGPEPIHGKASAYFPKMSERVFLIQGPRAHTARSVSFIAGQA